MKGIVRVRLFATGVFVLLLLLFTTAPGPTGTGYLMEVVQNDRVIDRFEFWPTEVVVHGQRWQITDTELAAKLRMLWFAEMPHENKSG